MLRVKDFDHLVLNVSDVERALEFYCGPLGLEPVRVDEWRSGTVSFPSVRVSPTTVIDLLDGPRGESNVDHICLVVEPLDWQQVIDSGTFTVLDGPGERFGARGRAQSLYVEDPDGNTVELRWYPQDAGERAAGEPLAREVRDLADRAAVVDTVTAYATALDTRDWEALRGLFTEDASWEYSGSGIAVSGPEAVVRQISAGVRPLDATQHLLGNHVVTVSGDEAEHTCYFHAQHVRTGLPGGETFLGAGRYEDRLRRTPDGWRLARRVVTSVWSEGNPGVFGGEPDAGTEEGAP